MESNIEKAVDDIKLDTAEDRIETAQKLNSALSDKQLEFNLQKWAERFTPEYMAELEVKDYEQDREYPENFSNWYPHIKDFGYFKCADVISNQIFTLEETKEFKKENFADVDIVKLKKILKPTLDKMEHYKVYNIKNGCFSNKFNFETSRASDISLVKKMWDINYQSSLFDTGGYTELVVREYIPYNPLETPTIYNGMPMREEVRVFYNMDKQEIEYIEDYWKYSYCEPHINNLTDKIIFKWFHNKLKTRKVQHRERLQKLKDIIYDNIHTLKFDGELKGIWSIDFMYVDDDSRYSGLWLIDMARGFRSAYWNIDKLTYSTRKKMIEEMKNGR